MLYMINFLPINFNNWLCEILSISIIFSPWHDIHIGLIDTNIPINMKNWEIIRYLSSKYALSRLVDILEIVSQNIIN